MLIISVPKGGLEPPLRFRNQILSLVQTGGRKFTLSILLVIKYFTFRMQAILRSISAKCYLFCYRCFVISDIINQG